MAGMYCLNDLLGLLAREGAVELKLVPGVAPMMLASGQWRPMDIQKLTSDDISELFQSFATHEQLEELRLCGDTRFNHSFQNHDRFAIRASLDRESLSLDLKRLGR